MPTGIKWKEKKWERVNDHISRKLVKKEHIMMVMYRLDPHQVWPLEIHEAEQGGYVFQGRIELNLPRTRQTLVLESGDGYLIESNLPHSWRTLEEEAVIMDIFSPPREELLRNKYAPNAVE
jgi:quercetin dioxygenase-like cupin family protein